MQMHDDLIKQYSTWLKSISETAAKRWRLRLDKEHESAMAEASVWQLLSSNAANVTLGESSGIGGLDFRCHIETGIEFYVEVTNFDTESLSRKTGLPESVDDWHGGGVVDIAREYLRKRRSKQDQIEHHSVDCPVLIAMTAFHATATLVHFDKKAASDLLIPPTARRVPFHTDPDDNTPLPPSWEEPLFEHACFFQKGPRENTFIESCPNVSGILLFGIPWSESGTGRPCAYAALNPTARYPFNPDWLADIPMCKLKADWSKIDPCDWSIEWMNDA